MTTVSMNVDEVSTSNNLMDDAIEVTSTPVTTTTKAKTRGRVLVSKQKQKEMQTVPLSLNEQKQYEKLKTRVLANYAKGYEASVMLGNDLLEIKEKKLYREEYPSWQDFLDIEFEGLKQNSASRQIQAARLEKRLEEAGIAREYRPQRESQARQLLHVLPDNLRQVVMDARDMAGDGAITADHFRRAAEKYKPVVDEAISKPKKAREDMAKPSTVITPLDLGYNVETGDLSLCFGSEESATETISLTDLIRKAGIPERALRDALYTCFGTVGIIGPPEMDDALEEAAWRTEEDLMAA